MGAPRRVISKLHAKNSLDSHLGNFLKWNSPVELLYTSLPFSKTRSIIGALVVSGATQPSVYHPPWMPPPTSHQPRTKVKTHQGCAHPHGTFHPPSMNMPPPAWCIALCSLQRSTLVFGAKSLVWKLQASHNPIKMTTNSTPILKTESHIWGFFSNRISPSCTLTGIFLNKYFSNWLSKVLKHPQMQKDIFWRKKRWPKRRWISMKQKMFETVKQKKNTRFFHWGVCRHLWRWQRQQPWQQHADRPLRSLRNRYCTSAISI